MINLNQYLNEVLIKSSSKVVSSHTPISLNQFIKYLKKNRLEIEGPDLSAIAYIYKKNSKQLKTRFGSRMPIPYIQLDMHDTNWKVYYNWGLDKNIDDLDKKICICTHLDKAKVPIYDFVDLPKELDKDESQNTFFLYNLYNAEVLSELLYSL